MSKSEKLLQKAINNPCGLSFKDFLTMMKQNGWRKLRHEGTSHQCWIDDKGGPVLPVQSLRGKAKKYQVEQFLKILRGAK